MKKIALIVLGVVLGFAIPTWAARNSGGTFTWTAPGGEVAQAGQTISSAWANASLAETRQALTDSLSRSGQGGMLYPLKVCSTATGGTVNCGTASTPGLFFDGSTNTGIYLDSGPTLSASVSGTNSLDITTTGVTVNGALAASGTVRTAEAFIAGDPGAGSNHVALYAPTLATNVNLYLPSTTAAGTTLPVTMTTGGQLGTGQITNSMQNFGAPSASTDVATKLYVDDQILNEYSSAWTSASSTPSNIVGAAISVAANSFYRFSVFLTVYDAGSCVGSANFQFTGPAGASIQFNMMGGNTSTGYVGGYVSGFSTLTANVPCNAAATPVLLDGWISTAGTAGTVQLQGRKTATGSGTIGVYSGATFTAFLR